MSNEAGAVSRLALRFTAWSERSIPDAFVFALAATILVFVLAVTVGGATPGDAVESWGDGFFKLNAFTMQMALIVVTGYVLGTSGPVARLIVRVARLARTDRGATVMVALFSMLTSWLNWGFSLTFSAMLARETARQRPGADYRALAASSFLGLGSIWAQGLSGSAALQMSSPGAQTISREVRDVVAHGGLVPGGVISLTHTIFLWQSFACVAVEIAVVALAVWLATPPAARAKTAAALGVDLTAGGGPDADPWHATDRDSPGEKARRTLGEWLEHSPVLNVALVLLGAAYVVQRLARAGSLAAAQPSATTSAVVDATVNAVNVDTINLTFLMLGLLLHGTPHRLMRAVRSATPATWGILLQFPFYFGIEGLMTHSKLSDHIAHLFVSVSTPTTFPALVALYSALLGVFVPSGGSKWVIEAPYVIGAAHQHEVHLGWMVSVYDLGEALANLIQPFWMLPTLAILGLRARDVMGFTFVVFLVLLPVVLVLVTLMGLTLHYPL